jgi:hypothetical protein
LDEKLTEELLERWRNDPRGAYQNWFLWQDRLKHFRSIRRGVQQVAGMTDILYQRRGEVIASQPPDLGVLGTGWMSVARAVCSPAMSAA